MYEFSYELKEIISKYYEENICRVATSTTEIKDVVTSDKLVVPCSLLLEWGSSFAHL